MTAKVICFASAKGGTGKTVLSATFAEFLSSLDKKVLLIDADADTNGLTIFYLDKMLLSKERKLQKEFPIHGIVQLGEFADFLPTSFKLGKNLDMIPATYVMEQTSKIQELWFRAALSETLTKLRGNYDYIFIDAQAGADSYAEIAIELSDEVIIISEYDPVSLAGIDRMTKVFSKIMPYDKRWILYNKVLPEFARKIGEVRIAERILSPIHWDEEVVRAFALRKLALDTVKGNAYTLAIMRTLSSLLGADIEKEIQTWKEKKSEEIRKPIRDQLTEVEGEMLALEGVIAHQQGQIEDLRKRSNRYLWISVSSLISIIAYSYLILVYAFGATPEISLVAAITTWSAGLLVILTTRSSIEKRSRLKETSRKAELAFSLSKLDELKYNHQKLRALAESDLDELFPKTKRQAASGT